MMRSQLHTFEDELANMAHQRLSGKGMVLREVRGKHSSLGRIDGLRSMLPREARDDELLSTGCRLDPEFLNAIQIAAMGEEVATYEVHEQLNRDGYVVKKLARLISVLEGEPPSSTTFHEIKKISHMHLHAVKQMVVYEDPQLEACLAVHNDVLVCDARVTSEQGWLEYILGPTWGPPPTVHFQHTAQNNDDPDATSTHTRLSRMLEQARNDVDKLGNQLSKKEDEFKQARALLFSDVKSDDPAVRRRARRTLFKVAKESDPISTDICLALAFVFWTSQQQSEADDRGSQYWAGIEYWDGPPQGEEQGRIAREARSIMEHEFAADDIDSLMDSVSDQTQTKPNQVRALKIMGELMCTESPNMSEELRSHVQRDICSMCANVARGYAEEASMPDVGLPQILTPLAVRMLLYVIKRNLSLLEGAKVKFWNSAPGAVLARRESTLMISHLASNGARPALSFLTGYVITHQEWSIRELGIVVLTDILLKPFYLEMYQEEPRNYLDVGVRPIARAFLDTSENGGVIRAARTALDRLMRQVECLLRHVVPWCTDEFALKCDPKRWKDFVALCAEIDPVYMEKPVRSMKRAR